MARCFVGPPKVPTFNLTCNIWFSQFGPPPIGLPPNVVSLCQLTLGDRGYGVAFGSFNVAYVLVPKLTDVHWLRGGILPADAIECPAGSGRYYAVQGVDDVGKGFANEYRQVACLVLQFPTPIP